VRIALVYPPTTDPTAPYLAVPMLTGFLRAHGVEVLPVDANVEAWRALLRPEPLLAAQARIETRLRTLERRDSLDHAAQLEYATLWQARGDAHLAHATIEAAIDVFADEEAFYDPARYGAAVQAVERAQRVISAAHAPLELNFSSYRTPFSLLTQAEIELQDRIKADRDRIAQKLGFEATLIANRSQLAQIARAPKKIGEILLPWQASLLQSEPALKNP
jgi:hypothetical protein